MFDVSFFELLVIGVVALIVIGPERLPGAVRTTALWIGRIKRSLAETRRELEKHIGADEIRRELHNEQVLYNLEKMKDTRQELEARIREFESGNLLTGEAQSSAPPASSDHTEGQSSPTVQTDSQEPPSAQSESSAPLSSDSSSADDRSKH